MASVSVFRKIFYQKEKFFMGKPPVPYAPKIYCEKPMEEKPNNVELGTHFGMD